MTIRSSLTPNDYCNLRYALSMDSEQFITFYNELDEENQQYLSSLLETHRLDILDHAFDSGGLPGPDIVDIISKVK